MNLYKEYNTCIDDFAMSESPTPTTETISRKDFKTVIQNAWEKWFAALKAILPLYILMHVAFLALAFFSPLFNIPKHSPEVIPISMLWQEWFRWDVAFYRGIAVDGYTNPHNTVFFPLYPLCIRLLSTIIPDPFFAGVVISNVALLVVCMVFYQLVLEDFGIEQSRRAVFYLLIFPSAFFFLTAYTESLFLCLSVLCFYHMRRGHWWLAGIFGLFGSLTRSVGVMMAVPFFFEYLRQQRFFEGWRQRRFKWQALLRLDLLSTLLILAGLGIYCLYCYWCFGDFFAFSTAEAKGWGRALHMPWVAFQYVYQVIQSGPGLLNFAVLNTLLAFSVDLFMLTVITLSIVGPWRFPRTHWVYCLYAVVAATFFHMGTVTTKLPLEALVRYYLTVFPAFILLATLGKNRTFHQGYVLISTALLYFSALLFLTGRWMT